MAGDISDEELLSVVEIFNKVVKIGRTFPCDDKTRIIECPVCGGKRSVFRASINGHIHSWCETEGCTSFME